MLDRLKNLNVDRIDIDDAVELATFARLAQTTYEGYLVPAPEWLKDGIATLDSEIKSRRRDMLLASKKELQARIAANRSREQRKADDEAALAKVNDALGNTTA